MDTTAENSITETKQSFGHQETIVLIEMLADLHERGVLTDAEFNAKKATLLSKL